jgi:hypothetical protein
MGSDRVGAPALVDSYRPGAFAMAKFEPSAETKGRPRRHDDVSAGNLADRELNSVIRRFRSPIPARVTLEQGRPVRVVTDRRGVSGGKVESCDGPWRSSGDWWAPCATPVLGAHWWNPHAPWNCDEWDVMLSDGSSYRISRCLAEREPANADRGQWFVDGMLD